MVRRVPLVAVHDAEVLCPVHPAGGEAPEGLGVVEGLDSGARGVQGGGDDGAREGKTECDYGFDERGETVPVLWGGGWVGVRGEH